MMMTTMTMRPTTSGLQSSLQTSYLRYQTVRQYVTMVSEHEAQAVQLSGVDHRHLVSRRQRLSMYRNDIWIWRT